MKYLDSERWLRKERETWEIGGSRMRANDSREGKLLGS